VVLGRLCAQVGLLDAGVFGQGHRIAGEGNLADLEDVRTMADFEGQAGVLLDQENAGPGLFTATSVSNTTPTKFGESPTADEDVTHGLASQAGIASPLHPEDGQRI
jgi:hypothetical protein